MFTDRLNSLMKARNINKSVLSKESGIPYTTIDGFYKKGYQNVKLSTLKKLCSYFDVTLDYLVGDDDLIDVENSLPDITVKEKEILEIYRQGKSSEKAGVKALIDAVDKLLGEDE